MSALCDAFVYKILDAGDARRARQIGHTCTALDTGDGYVHLSTRAQVAETLALHYAGRSGVELFEFAARDLPADLRWEPSRGGQLFPHLYAPLRLDMARRHWALTLDARGNPALPADLDPPAETGA